MTQQTDSKNVTSNDPLAPQRPLTNFRRRISGMAATTPRLAAGRATRALLLVTALVFATLSHLTPRSFGQAQTGCGDRRCQVSKVVLNTGYDQTAAAPYPSTSLPNPDGYWQLVDSPNPGLTVPAPAWAITPNSVWSTLPQTNWISAYNTDAQLLLNPAPANPYSFQRCFCTCPGVRSVNINLTILVDDSADVFFDNIPIPPSITPPDLNLPGITITTTQPVNPVGGKHCLTVAVRNTFPSAMGLDIAGAITSAVPPGTFLSPSCCEPFGKIIGRKIDDQNCNGKLDSNEQGLPGWTILATSTSGTSIPAVTDANGWYYFNSLPPGTYTISEQQQTGWSQTVPGGVGTYTVTLAAGQVIERDFFNCRPPCARVSLGNILCKAGSAGSYTFTFNLTNLSGVTMHYLLFTPIGSFTIAPPSPMPLTPPLQSGQPRTITVTLSGGVKAGDCFKVTMVAFDPTAPEPVKCENCCCSIDVCVPELPDCNCVQFRDESVRPVRGAPGTYTYSFCIDNLAAYTVTSIYLYAPTGVTITPSVIPVSVPTGQHFCGSVTITGGTPGTQLQFGVSVHDQGLTQCCAKTHSIFLPEINPVTR
jgi:hypothetical protein